MANDRDDFEFYNMPKSKIHFDNYPNVDYQAVQRQKAERRREIEQAKRKQRKVRAISYLLVLALGFGTGYTVASEVGHYIKGGIEYSSNQTEMAGMWENFSMTKDGYLLGLDVKYEEAGFFEEVTEIDYENPENVHINPNTGKKQGALVDYFDALDRYFMENQKDGKGYYEMVKRQNELLDLFGVKHATFIYSQDELIEIINSRSNSNSLGGK